MWQNIIGLREQMELYRGQWLIQGRRWGQLPPYLLIFFSKIRFIRVKGIYFVVCICDKCMRTELINCLPLRNFWIRH